jgi:putative PIN family toxin of toxin-antitoxin system
MRSVLDTNVIVSASLVKGGKEDQILRAWQRGAFELVLSSEILAEIGRAFSYEKLQKLRWMTPDEAVELLELLAKESVLVPGTVIVKACRDSDDDKFIGAALEGKARYIVTGGKDLLDLEAYKSVRVVSPAAFLKILQGAKRNNS